MAMNFDQARFNMVEQQVRPWDVLDDTILGLLASVPREDFVPPRYQNLAFADLNIPLDHGEVMMRPILEGRMLQSLALSADETVLEVGTGSGFITACLSQLAKSVCSVDIQESFTASSKQKLDEKRISNVECHTGDVMTGWLPEQAHDVVVVTGSVSSIPQQFRDWVNPGGRLFVVTGNAPAMTAWLMTRHGVSDWEEVALFENDLPRLTNAEPAVEFEF